MSRKRGGIWAQLGSVAGMKVLVMGASGLIGIFTSRLIISSFGVDAYAQYGLLGTLPTLMPFADLGMVAVVINAIAGAEDPRTDPGVRRTLTTAFRILLRSGVVIFAAAVLLTVTGAWPYVLGRGGLLPGAEWVPLICIGVFVIGLPLSVGSRILVGLGRITTQIAATGITGPLMIGGVFLIATVMPAGGNYLAVVTYIVAALVSLLCLVLAARALPGQVTGAIREIRDRKRFPSVKAAHLAGPMVLQMLVLPIAMQTDRLLLSHLTRGDELAQYNLGSQLFNIVVQTISAAGVALWPIFARARSKSQIVSPVRTTVIFGALGAAAGLAILVVSPWLVEFVTKGAFALDPWLLGGFVVFVTLEAAKYPVGMYMTDAKGLRFQVIPILILVPLNVAVSWVLTLVIGAGGPIIGSAVSVLLCQVIPYTLYVRRDLARRRAERDEAESPDETDDEPDSVADNGTGLE